MPQYRLVEDRIEGLLQLILLPGSAQFLRCVGAGTVGVWPVEPESTYECPRLRVSD